MIGEGFRTGLGLGFGWEEGGVKMFLRFPGVVFERFVVEDDIDGCFFSLVVDPNEAAKFDTLADFPDDLYRTLLLLLKLSLPFGLLVIACILGRGLKLTGGCLDIVQFLSALLTDRTEISDIVVMTSSLLCSSNGLGEGV